MAQIGGYINEVYRWEAQGLCKYIETGKTHKKPHVLAPLLGRFKSETGEGLILLALVAESNSGIKFRFWLEKLVELIRFEGRDQSAGPAFANKDGTIIASKTLNDELLRVLEIAQREMGLLPEKLEIDERFGTYRSLRVGATTRATVKKVPDRIIKLINRWSDVEGKGTSVPSFNMMDHYLDITQVLDSYLTYSQAL